MVKHTQAICRQFTDELLECVWPFCKIGAESLNTWYCITFRRFAKRLKTGDLKRLVRTSKTSTFDGDTT